MNKIGKENRAAVENLIINLSQFSDAVKNELDKMMSKAYELSDSWKDDQFKQFISFVEELNSSTRNDLSSLEKARDTLQLILSKY